MIFWEWLPPSKQSSDMNARGFLDNEEQKSNWLWPAKKKILNHGFYSFDLSIILNYSSLTKPKAEIHTNLISFATKEDKDGEASLT